MAAGVLLFVTSRPSTAVWDIPAQSGVGVLAVLVGLALLGVALLAGVVKAVTGR